MAEAGRVRHYRFQRFDEGHEREWVGFAADSSEVRLGAVVRAGGWLWRVQTFRSYSEGTPRDPQGLAMQPWAEGEMQSWGEPWRETENEVVEPLTPEQVKALTPPPAMVYRRVGGRELRVLRVPGGENAAPPEVGSTFRYGSGSELPLDSPYNISSLYRVVEVEPGETVVVWAELAGDPAPRAEEPERRFTERYPGTLKHKKPEGALKPPRRRKPG